MVKVIQPPQTGAEDFGRSLQQALTMLSKEQQQEKMQRREQRKEEEESQALSDIFRKLGIDQQEQQQQTPAGQQQAGGVTNQMMESLQQMGVPIPQLQQGQPQGAQGLVQQLQQGAGQQTQAGQGLLDTLQQLTGQQPQQQQDVSQMLAQQPQQPQFQRQQEPQLATQREEQQEEYQGKQPIGPEEYEDIQKKVKGSVGEQLAKTQQYIDAVQQTDDPRIRGKTKNQLLGNLYKRQTDLLKRQQEVENAQSDFVNRTEQGAEGAQGIYENIDQLQDLQGDIEQGQTWEGIGRALKSFLAKGSSAWAFKNLASGVAKAAGYGGGPVSQIVGTGIGMLMAPSFNLDPLKNPELAEGQQLQNQMQTNMEEMYGPQIGKDAAKNMLGNADYIMQNPKFLKKFNELQKFNAQYFTIKKNVLDQLRETNGGYLPRNAQSMVQKYTQDYRKKAYAKFKEIQNGLRNVPKTEKEQAQDKMYQEVDTLYQNNAFDLSKFGGFE